MYAIRKYDFGTRDVNIHTLRKKTTHLYPIYHLLQVIILGLEMFYFF